MNPGHQAVQPPAVPLTLCKIYIHWHNRAKAAMRKAYPFRIISEQRGFNRYLRPFQLQNASASIFKKFSKEFNKLSFFESRAFRDGTSRIFLASVYRGPNMKNFEWYLPEYEAADLPGCRHREVRELVKKGVLSFIIMPDRKLKISENSVQKILERREYQ